MKSSEVLAMEDVLRLLGKGIGGSLADTFGRRLGFCLVVFEFHAPGIANYISNADRAGMIKSMRETADRLEAGQDFPAVFPTMQ